MVVDVDGVHVVVVGGNAGVDVVFVHVGGVGRCSDGVDRGHACGMVSWGGINNCVGGNHGP